MLPLYAIGATIVVEERWHDLPWSAEPHRVVPSSVDELVTWMPAGADAVRVAQCSTSGARCFESRLSCEFGACQVCPRVDGNVAMRAHRTDESAPGGLRASGPMDADSGGSKREDVAASGRTAFDAAEWFAARVRRD